MFHLVESCTLIGSSCEGLDQRTPTSRPFRLIGRKAGKRDEVGAGQRNPMRALDRGGSTRGAREEVIAVK